jgi:hypothetical protein
VSGGTIMTFVSSRILHPSYNNSTLFRTANSKEKYEYDKYVFVGNHDYDINTNLKCCGENTTYLL